MGSQKKALNILSTNNSVRSFLTGSGVVGISPVQESYTMPINELYNQVKTKRISKNKQKGKGIPNTSLIYMHTMKDYSKNALAKQKLSNKKKEFKKKLEKFKKPNKKQVNSNKKKLTKPKLEKQKLNKKVKQSVKYNYY